MSHCRCLWWLTEIWVGSTRFSARIWHSNRFSAEDNDALGTLSSDFGYANLIDLWRGRRWRIYSLRFEIFIRPTWNIYCLALDPVPPSCCSLVRVSWVSARVPVEWSGARCCVWRGKLQQWEHGCCNQTCMMPCERHFFFLLYLFFRKSIHTCLGNLIPNSFCLFVGNETCIWIFEITSNKICPE